MSLQLQNEVARRLARRASHPGPPASALFGRSVRLLDAAEDLTRTTLRQPRGDALVSTVGCLSATLEALATASVQLSLMARSVAADEAEPAAEAGESDDGEDVTRLLFAASQNLRIAAEATKLAQRSFEGSSRVPLEPA